MPIIWKLTPEIAGQVDGLFESIEEEKEVESRLREFVRENYSELMSNPNSKLPEYRFLDIIYDFYGRLDGTKLDDNTKRRLQLITLRHLLVQCRWVTPGKGLPGPIYDYMYRNGFNMWQSAKARFVGAASFQAPEPIHEKKPVGSGTGVGQIEAKPGFVPPPLHEDPPAEEGDEDAKMPEGVTEETKVAEVIETRKGRRRLLAKKR